MFSQSGQEISDIAERTGLRPNRIITTNKDIGSYYPKIWESCLGDDMAELYHVTKKSDYDTMFKTLDVLDNHADVLITMHGFLRVIPSDICDKYNIVNLHPGHIIDFPHLKGKDPQARAYEEKLPYTGCVLHKAIGEVDSGEVISSNKCAINSTVDIKFLYANLRECALELWCEYLDQNL